MLSFTNSSDDSGHNFGDVSSGFESLRISAIRKASQIYHYVDSVTIGPNCIVKNDENWNEDIENKPNNYNLNSPKKASEKSEIMPSPITRSGTTFSEQKIYVEHELLRREEVRKVIDKKWQQMEKTKRELEQETALMREIYAINREKKEAAELAKLEAEENELAQQNEVKRRHEQKLNTQRLQERKERFEREAEEHRIFKEREEIILRLKNNIRDRCKDFGVLSKTCKNKNSVSQILGPCTAKLKNLSQQMEYISEKARRGELSAADVQFAEQITRQSEEILNECASEIARFDILYEEEIARREHEMNLAEANAQIENANIQRAALQLNAVPGGMQQILQSELDVAQPIGGLPETPPNEITTNSSEIGITTTDSLSVDPVTCKQNQEICQMYFATKQLLEQCTESHDFREFLDSSATKKFRFECQKAINIPINTISAVNGSHLMEKYNKLRYLLNGQSSLNVNQHPQGPLFCKNLLAKNIVNQGETLVSSKSETAFGIAAVTLALMIDFPDFAELLKAHFYKTCPYLMPFFPLKLQGQNDEEHYRELGYKYTEGAVETQPKFLTRMSGVGKLYAAIIVANRRRGVTDPHPLGLQTAWRWLAATINYDVQPKFVDICATLILDMLMIVGNSLWRAYPRQCPKLLKLLREHYYPQVQNCGGISGPAVRLEEFLNECITRNSIPPPDGQLPSNFW